MRPEPFNAITIGLKGTRLIEASAGTGKTYSIALLFLRLIVEEGIPLEEILVVTYTRAATAELKGRIRAFLRMAMRAWKSGEAESPDVLEIVKACRERADAQERLESLRTALLCLDEAAIFTIHGFCQRILGDNAFETGAAYDAEMVTDQDDFIAEVVLDFYRSRISSAPRPVFSCLSARMDVDHLIKFVKTGLNHQLLKADYPRDAGPAPAMEVWHRLKACWDASSDEIKKQLSEPGVFKQNFSIYKTANLPGLFHHLDYHFSSGMFAADIIGQLDIEYMREKQVTKAGQPLPSHEFFQLCGEAVSVFRPLPDHYLGELFTFIRRELPRRKEARNIQYFDDLLFRLYDVLKNSPRGRHLVQTIRGRYRAALIDEFQDTDSLQYYIFHSIFHHEKGVLYLIGDPKQSIYGFRGADVFSYIEASRSAEMKYTLQTNWRSEAPLVLAFNELFGRERPFLYEEITYENVMASGQADQKPLLMDGMRKPPLVIWNFDSPEPLVKGAVQDDIYQAVASEIVSLIDGGAMIGDRAVRAGDMAVLVQSWYEGRAMKSVLERHNIPAIMTGAASVFSTREAADICAVLAAVMEPSAERTLRGALITDMMGFTPADIHRYNGDEALRESWMERFRHYNRLWGERGFIAMMSALTEDGNLRERLVSMSEGERRLTNFTHLTELLHKHSSEGITGKHDLIRWLQERIALNASEIHAEEYEQRLESDESAVTIVTIHRSKGLQYPVVFCPFLWDQAELRDKDAFSWHSGSTEILSIGTGDAESIEAARREILAEKLRLFYVAVTRAVHRCYLVWGNFKHCEDSAAWYFLGDMENRFGKSKVISIETPPPPGQSLKRAQERGGELNAALFTGRLSTDFRISSFSSMTEKGPGAEDRDADIITSPAGTTPPEAGGIFRFPRGARAGTALHSIFENVDFGAANHRAEVESLLRGFNLAGAGDEYIPVIEEMVRNVLSAELPADPPFSLADIPAEDRIPELEFYFSVPDLRGRDFSFLEGNGAVDPFTGFVHGFMDLVFRKNGRYYIVDWKSNHLGDLAEDYDRENMHRAMIHHRYNLQYMIYCLALHRHLSSSLKGYSYDENFGGVFYIFIRGVRTGSHLGIYHERPAFNEMMRMAGIFGLEEFHGV
jgi:exodeoxyribonuclease V beta subunit